MKKVSILILLFSVGIGNMYAQSALERLGKKIVKRAGEQVEQRVEQKAEEGVEKAMDKAEEATRNSGKEKMEKEKPTKAAKVKPTESKPQQEPQTSLQSFSQYDFVPGDKVLLYEDFSQDAVGDFPALWTTDGSGEIKTLNIAEGKWLHLNAEGKIYQLMKNLELPDNYIVEFDAILPKGEIDGGGLWLTLYKSEDGDNGTIESYIRSKGVSLYADFVTGWIGKSYNNCNWSEGNSEIGKVKPDIIEHIIIWVQKRRLRVYHAGQKVLDLPTLIPAGLKPDRLAFDISDNNGILPYVSNIRITTASPDTRNMLLDEGKLISYGIYFDINSDKIKPESYGALNDIAKVIKEANVKVQIVGHTDNTGSDATNLNLSKRRSASVKAELVKLGVSGSLLTTDGLGASDPIAPNNTPSNKALNRRVEFVKQ